MVARKFLVRHNDSTFDVDYDTDDGFDVFKIQLFSLTSIPPDHQKIIRGDDDRELLEDSDLISVSDKLRLVSVTEASEVEIGGHNEDLLKSDEEFARMLQAEEEALMLQQFVLNDEGGKNFEGRIRPYVSQVLMYEDPVQQEAACKTVPVEELEEKALVSLAKEGNLNPSKVQQDHAFLLQLLFWFKQSFRWVNAPQCEGCGNETAFKGMGTPLALESQYGASRVEIYSCWSCKKITRFPRYNDPMKLVETRKGRCGEWANCFTLYCRAFGYESWLILDFTDHVWTECFSPLLERWMHLDPCEGVYDQPLLYEKGWNKKLNYVIAIAKDGVYDVTKRYTRKWPEVISRRNITTESTVSFILNKITKEYRVSFPSHVISALEDRDKRELEELERDVHSVNDASVSLPGRQSGNEEWRISRSEIGTSDKWSISGSSCITRLCIDEHVTRIYNAFFPILSYFVENSFSGARVVNILEILKGSLVDLRKLNYKTRRASINPFMLPFLSCFDKLLDSLSMKSEIDNDGKVDLCLANDPVKTALALPVALDALDDLICDVRKLENLTKDTLSLSLLRLNRIHSGSVSASSEELPVGIVTSAFDGLCASKWEEPNGAKGCWILYKLPENQMQELAAYDLMSANDAPERDPMDWVLEGSDDGGSNWCILDKQVGQVFENRFQRKTFTVKSENFRCNAFRFRFLAVKDSQSTSRLQLGSIDLYARAG